MLFAITAHRHNTWERIRDYLMPMLMFPQIRLSGENVNQLPDAAVSLTSSSDGDHKVTNYITRQPPCYTQCTHHYSGLFAVQHLQATEVVTVLT